MGGFEGRSSKKIEEREGALLGVVAAVGLARSVEPSLGDLKSDRGDKVVCDEGNPSLVVEFAVGGDAEATWGTTSSGIRTLSRGCGARPSSARKQSRRHLQALEQFGSGMGFLTFCGIGDLNSGTVPTMSMDSLSSSILSCSCSRCSCMKTLMILPIPASPFGAISPLKSPVDNVEVNRFDNEDPDTVFIDESRSTLRIEGVGEPAAARMFSKENELASGGWPCLLRRPDNLFEALRYCVATPRLSTCRLHAWQ